MSQERQRRTSSAPKSPNAVVGLALLAEVRDVIKSLKKVYKYAQLLDADDDDERFMRESIEEVLNRAVAEVESLRRLITRKPPVDGDAEASER
jgi:hypothetical protein